ncbi:AraC-like protein [Vibrio sp. ES.051]|uniref:AraC family transcriptional regulator n=1 Tax=Vibrio sp. ES.051 TaxID=1761909 RepID=UPI000BF3A2E8|nr:helix-turn-helix transcriptional regulator [Vibrio sp. ES.051]PFG58011.1 AraC-like protein [Vibrio sp. ES.051]
MTKKSLKMPTSYPNATILKPSTKAYILDSTKPVLMEKRQLEAGTGVPEHQHPRGQFIWAESGTFSILSNNKVWIVPTSCGIWIPSNAFHELSSDTKTVLLSLYVDPFYEVLSENEHAVVMKLSSLLKDVMKRLVSENTNQNYSRLLGLVVLEELSCLEQTTYWMPSGTDPRLKKLLSLLINEFSSDHQLRALAPKVGASPRTIERLFIKEIGLTFRAWKSRYKLILARDLIEQGLTTKSVAHEIGYKSIPSFTREFSKFFGVPPQQCGKSKCNDN